MIERERQMSITGENDTPPQIECRYEDGQPKHDGVQTAGTLKRIVAENADQGQKQGKQWSCSA